MKAVLTTIQLDLLREVVKAHCPELITLLASGILGGINQEDRRTIIGALGKEFAATGVASNSEPNARGLRLEKLIDFVNRPLIER